MAFGFRLCMAEGLMPADAAVRAAVDAIEGARAADGVITTSSYSIRIF
jgi:hypothetical protein